MVRGFHIGVKPQPEGKPDAKQKGNQLGVYPLMFVRGGNGGGLELLGAWRTDVLEKKGSAAPIRW